MRFSDITPVQKLLHEPLIKTINEAPEGQVIPLASLFDDKNALAYAPITPHDCHVVASHIGGTVTVMYLPSTQSFYSMLRPDSYLDPSAKSPFKIHPINQPRSH